MKPLCGLLVDGLNAARAQQAELDVMHRNPMLLCRSWHTSREGATVGVCIGGKSWTAPDQHGRACKRHERVDRTAAGLKGITI